MDNQGTNQYLQPMNAPVTQSQGATSAYDFFASNERNSINLTKIKNFNFSSGFGGTLTLGGTANGNGLMRVLSSSGGTIVTVDNAGITIDNGNILIKNATGSTILDTTGIVSTANFPQDFLVDPTTHTTNSNTLVDVPGSSLTSYTLTRPARVLIILNVSCINTSYPVDESLVRLSVNDSLDGDKLAFALPMASYITHINQDVSMAITGWSLNIDNAWSSSAVLIDASAGTHTLKLQYATTGAGATEIDLYEFGYVVLGS